MCVCVCVCVCVSKCLHSVRRKESKNIYVRLNIFGDDMSLKNMHDKNP